MTLQEWRSQREKFLVSRAPKELLDQLEGYPQDAVAIVYPGLCFMVLMGNVFHVIVGNIEDQFYFLENAEDFLWTQWASHLGL